VAVSFEQGIPVNAASPTAGVGVDVDADAQEYRGRAQGPVHRRPEELQGNP